MRTAVRRRTGPKVLTLTSTFGACRLSQPSCAGGEHECHRSDPVGSKIGLLAWSNAWSATARRRARAAGPSHRRSPRPDVEPPCPERGGSTSPSPVVHRDSIGSARRRDTAARARHHLRSSRESRGAGPWPSFRAAVFTNETRSAARAVGRVRSRSLPPSWSAGGLVLLVLDRQHRCSSPEDTRAAHRGDPEVLGATDDGDAEVAGPVAAGVGVDGADLRGR